jgi:hypothetical protein
MLKHAIDVYNFLLDIIDFIKKPSLNPKAFILSTFALVLMAGSLFSMQAFSGVSADEQPRQTIDSESLPLAQQSAEAQKKADKTSAADVKTETAVADNKATGAAGHTTGTIDTRPVGMDESKASKSFYLPITKNNQYDAGTVISYDAIKDEKAYYGGDLVFSVASLTISKSNPEATANTLKVNSPDSANINVPAKPTDDNSPFFTVSLDASQSTDVKYSYNMVVELSGSQVPVGTYQLHIATKSGDPVANTLWYHGFVTVNVID